MFLSFSHFNRKHFVLVALVLITLFSFSSTVLAQAPGVAATDIPGGNFLQGILWTIVNVFFGWLVYAGGSLLNIGVNNFVIGFGDFYINRGLGAQIDSLWVVVRDIFNLTFIFGLVGIGLRMIFNSSDSSTRKMLISLILAALLVNFSLFITKFVVDFSNIAAVQLVGAFPQQTSASGVTTANVSGHFMELMGLTGIFNTGGNTTFNAAQLTAMGGLGYIFGTMILYIVAGFVFMAGGILLLIRFAVLNIYMVLSPLMFIGWVFPSASGITSQFWKGFLGRAFFAPAFILMLYFSQRILSTFSAGGTSASLGQVFRPGSQSQADFAAVVPPFILTAIFLIASIVIAQKMGANGASGFVSMGQNLAGRARKTAMFGGKYVGGYAVSKVRSGLDRVAQDDGNTTTKPILRQIRQVARGVARGASVYGGRAVLNAGASTYDSSQAKTKKAWNEQYARDAAAKDASTIETGMNTAAQLAAIKARIGAGTHTAADLAALPGLEKIERDMISAITGLAVSELEKLSPGDWSKYAPHLTSSQVESVMKSDNINQQSKANIIKARQSAISAAVGATGSIMTKELTKLTIDQIETMGDDWIRDNAYLFSLGQMDELKKSKKFTPSQRNSFTSARDGWHTAAVAGLAYAGKPTDIQELFEHKDNTGTFVGDRKPEDIASLGSKVLLDRASTMFISAAALEAIAAKKTLTPAERSTLKANLLAYPGPRSAEVNTYLRSPEGVRYYS